MGTWPTRNQQSPDYWDAELKGYIDDADAANASATAANATAISNETTRATTAENSKIPLSQRGAANGVPTLDSGALVPQAQLPAHLTPSALASTYAAYLNLAKSPDTIITGAITRNSDGVVTSAAVVWPDGTAGTFTATTINSTYKTIDAYTITYGTHTFTQSTITRDSNGAATNVPAMTYV